MKVTSLIFVMALLLGCNKNKTYTLEGIMLYDCDTPLANHDLVLVIPGNSSINIPFQTNDSGYFKINYPKIKQHTFLKKAPILLIIGANGIKIDHIKGNSNVDFGVLPPVKTKKTFDLFLDVVNPYSEEYELKIPDYRTPNPFSNQIILQGPFSSGILYTAENVPILLDISNYWLNNSMDSELLEFLIQYYISGLETNVLKTSKSTLGLPCDNEHYQVVIKIE